MVKFVVIPMCIFVVTCILTLIIQVAMLSGTGHVVEPLIALMKDPEAIPILMMLCGTSFFVGAIISTGILMPYYIIVGVCHYSRRRKQR